MKFLGVTDEITTCERCGKNNLKRTVAIETETGDVVYYGCDCAARALMPTVKGVNTRDINKIADIMAYAEKWLKVYSLDIVCNGISNRYGYSVEVKGDCIRMKTMAGVIEFRKKN